MTKYIEQFWRAATPSDAIKEPPMVARFRGADGGDWMVANLFGYRRGDHCWLCDELLGIWAQGCEVYDEPGWHRNKPEPGEGYRLLEKFPEPESIITGDEFKYGKNWHEAGTSEQEPTTWYRRKIEPAAVTEDTGSANKPILCPFVRLAEHEGMFFPLKGGELIQIGDVYHHERDATKVCDVAEGLSYAGLHVREVDACLKFYRPVQANECKPAAGEPVKFVAHPIQLDDSGVWRFKSTPIQDRSYAVLNEQGHYLQWIAGSRPEYVPEFRHAFTPARLLQVSIRELGRNIRLRAVELVDVDKLKQDVRQKLQPRPVEPTPTYEPGTVYEHNGRKFRLAVKGEEGYAVFGSNIGLPDALQGVARRLISVRADNFKRYQLGTGLHFQYAFVEIHEPKQPPQPEYAPFEWQDRHLLKNRYVRRKDDSHREFLISEISLLWDGTVEVRFSNKSIYEEELFRDYVFDDDTPCGKRVEQ